MFNVSSVALEKPELPSPGLGWHSWLAQYWTLNESSENVCWIKQMFLLKMKVLGSCIFCHWPWTVLLFLAEASVRENVVLHPSGSRFGISITVHLKINRNIICYVLFNLLCLQKGILYQCSQFTSLTCMFWNRLKCVLTKNSMLVVVFV